jgi:hypothetical protein
MIFWDELGRNDSVVLGDRGRPADQIERDQATPTGLPSSRAEVIGGTPMAATGTVAIPFSIG